MEKEQSEFSIYAGETFKETCYFLTILFCVLRACEIITWSWFWVMSPIFISWIIGVLFITIRLFGIQKLINH